MISSHFNKSSIECNCDNKIFLPEERERERERENERTDWLNERVE